MPQFILTYVGGGAPATPEAGRDHMDRYMAWVESLGEASIIPQQPLRGTTMLGDPAATTPIMGFTIIQVENMAVALAVAESCPFLELPGAAMQVSELALMRPQRGAEG